MEEPLVYLFLSAFAFLIGILITRAIFSIPTFLKIQKAKLHILTEIALKQGVKPEIVRSIYAQHELTTRSKTNEEFREELPKND